MTSSIKKGTIEYRVRKFNGASKRVISIKDTPYTKAELNDLLKHGFLRGDNGPGDDYIADFAIEWHKKHKEMSKYKEDLFTSPIAMGRRFVSAFDVKEDGGYIEIVLGNDKVLYVKHKVNKKVVWYKLENLTISNVSTFRTKWEKTILSKIR